MLGFLIVLGPLVLISIDEFLAPRKTDPQYIAKTRRGWIVLCVVTAIILTFKFYTLSLLAGEYRFYYSGNFLFYLGLIFVFGLFIASAAMTVYFSVLKYRQDNITGRYR